MSRIHEALKKAAQERSANLSDRPASELGDLTAEGLTGALLPEGGRRTQERPISKREDNSGFLRFQEYTRNCSRPAWLMDPRSTVFGAEAMHPAGAERFRTLRSRLYQIAAITPIPRLLVTSSLPAEGKTFVTANLAQSIVRQPNRSVLLIDADLRAPRLHAPFNAPTSPGLSDFLRGEAEENQVIQVGPEGNLCLITGGTHISNPSELLHSARMKQFLEKASQIFDWVILDSPPALAVHDASILADMVDGVLFVVRAGATEASVAEKAAQEFREKNLLGVVLNRVEKNDIYGGYYYGYPAEKDKSQDNGATS